jgi:hypothetical protein
VEIQAAVVLAAEKRSRWTAVVTLHNIIKESLIEPPLTNPENWPPSCIYFDARNNRYGFGCE